MTINHTAVPSKNTVMSWYTSWSGTPSHSLSLKQYSEITRHELEPDIQPFCQQMQWRHDTQVRVATNHNIAVLSTYYINSWYTTWNGIRHASVPQMTTVKSWHTSRSGNKPRGVLPTNRVKSWYTSWNGIVPMTTVKSWHPSWSDNEPRSFLWTITIKLWYRRCKNLSSFTAWYFGLFKALYLSLPVLPMETSLEAFSHSVRNSLFSEANTQQR